MTYQKMSDEEFNDAMEAKVAELNKYIEDTFDKMTKHIMSDVKAFHRKTHMFVLTPQYLKCEAEFVQAFVEKVFTDNARKNGKTPVFLAVEVAVDEEESHTHEPSEKDKNKDDGTGLYL